LTVSCQYLIIGLSEFGLFANAFALDLKGFLGAHVLLLVEIAMIAMMNALLRLDFGGIECYEPCRYFLSIVIASPSIISVE
jgi:hypothetical protein